MAGQVDALRDAALGTVMLNTPQTGDTQLSGGTDSVFNTILPDVTGRIRAYIASNPRNRLSQTPFSVPPELLGATVWLILNEMVTRLSIALPLNETQKKQIELADEDLNRLRNVNPPFLAVSNPVDPEPNPELTVGVNAVVVRHSHRHFTQKTLKAL